METMPLLPQHQPRPDAPPLRVDVWSWPLVPSDQPLLAARWTREEEAALERLRDPDRRARTRRAWAVRRALLARALACPAEDIVWGRAPSGAPLLDHAQIPCAVSFAHSGDWAYLALSPCSALGVDVERIDPATDVLGLARRFGTAEEMRLLDSLAPAARAAAFFRIWTRKEAVLKAAGGGVPSRLREARVPCGPAGGWAELQTSGRVWHVQDLAAPPGYAAALATPRAASVAEHEVEPDRLLTA